MTGVQWGFVVWGSGFALGLVATGVRYGRLQERGEKVDCTDVVDMMVASLVWPLLLVACAVWILPKCAAQPLVTAGRLIERRRKAAPPPVTPEYSRGFEDGVRHGRESGGYR